MRWRQFNNTIKQYQSHKLKENLEHDNARSYIKYQNNVTRILKKYFRRFNLRLSPFKIMYLYQLAYKNT